MNSNLFYALLLIIAFSKLTDNNAPHVVNRGPCRAYVVSPYSANSNKGIAPELPRHCPHSNSESCEIVVDHLRERKTGPCFSLTVMRCKTHQIGFTLYPLGYYPYSRHTLAPVDVEGHLLTRSDEETSLFIGTLFEAATDAADGIPWLSQSNAGSLDLRFPTQIRHMQRAAILLGIAPETGHYLREETVQILALSGQLLNEAREKIILSECGFQCCGNEICKLLQCIPTGSLFDRLAEAGASAGLWKAPMFVINNMLQPSSFHRVRMRGSPEKKGIIEFHNFV